MTIHTHQPKPVSARTANVTLWISSAVVFACGVVCGVIVL